MELGRLDHLELEVVQHVTGHARPDEVEPRLRRRQEEEPLFVDGGLVDDRVALLEEATPGFGIGVEPAEELDPPARERLAVGDLEASADRER